MSFDIGENIQSVLIVLLIVAFATSGLWMTSVLDKNESTTITETDSTTSVTWKSGDKVMVYSGKKINKEQVDSLIKEWKK